MTLSSAHLRTQQSHPGGGARSIQTLFARMQRGDREAASEFMHRYGDRIRRRVRGKIQSSMRRLFDSQEIVSSVGRRLDRSVLNGAMSARDEREFWGFVFDLAKRAVVDKARLYQRLERVESDDSEFAFLLRQRFDRTRASEAEVIGWINEAIEQLEQPMDRQILQFWLEGEPHASIASSLGLSVDHVRKRWQRIRNALKHELEQRGINRRETPES